MSKCVGVMCGCYVFLWRRLPNSCIHHIHAHLSCLLAAGLCREFGGAMCSSAGERVSGRYWFLALAVFSTDSIGVAELNTRERTRYLAPEKQQIYEQMMCAAMQHVW